MKKTVDEQSIIEQWEKIRNMATSDLAHKLGVICEIAQEIQNLIPNICQCKAKQLKNMYEDRTAYEKKEFGRTSD